MLVKSWSSFPRGIVYTFPWKASASSLLVPLLLFSPIRAACLKAGIPCVGRVKLFRDHCRFFMDFLRFTFFTLKAKSPVGFLQMSRKTIASYLDMPSKDSLSCFCNFLILEEIVSSGTLFIQNISSGLGRPMLADL